MVRSSLVTFIHLNKTLVSYNNKKWLVRRAGLGFHSWPWCPLQISCRHSDFPMEVPSANGKWPCPLNDEIPGLVECFPLTNVIFIKSRSRIVGCYFSYGMSNMLRVWLSSLQKKKKNSFYNRLCSMVMVRCLPLLKGPRFSVAQTHFSYCSLL